MPRASEADRAWFFEQIGGGREVVDRIFAPANLAEVLPNQQHVTVLSSGKRSIGALSSGVLVGTITTVVDGKGYVGMDHLGDGQPESREVALDDPEMEWGYLAVQFTPARTTGVPESPLVFSLGVGPDDDIQRLRETALGLGDLVAVVEDWGNDEGSDYHIAELGTLLGSLATDGSIRFPALGHEERAFVGGLDTLEKLWTAATVDRDPVVHNLG